MQNIPAGRNRLDTPNTLPPARRTHPNSWPSTRDFFDIRARDTFREAKRFTRSPVAHRSTDRISAVRLPEVAPRGACEFHVPVAQGREQSSPRATSHRKDATFSASQRQVLDDLKQSGST